MKKINKIVIILIVFLLISSIAFSAYSSIDELYLSKFYEFFSDFYYKDIKTDDIIGGAFNQVLEDASIFSCYEKAQESSQLDLMTLGVKVVKVRTGLLISNVYPGSNGSKIGLKVGDIIYSINRISTSIINSNDLDYYISKLGNKALIEVIKSESGNIEKIQCELESGYLSRVDFFIEEDIGYIRINEFVDETSNDIEKAIKWFDDNSVNNIILDLRDLISMNIEEASEVANFFLPYGRIASGNNKVFSATYKKDYHNVHIIISNNTLGAGEVIARAIKNYNTGVVYGKRSSGLVELVGSYPVFTDEAFQKYSELTNSTSITSIISQINNMDISIQEEEVSGYMHIVEDTIKDNNNRTYENGVIPDYEINTLRETIDVNPQENAIWIRKDYSIGQLSYDIFIAEQIFFEMGLLNEKPDVVFDINTEQAVNKYKALIRLEQDSILDMTTQNILNYHKYKDIILNEQCIVELINIIRGE